MHDSEVHSDETTNSPGHPEADSQRAIYSGFLVLKLRAGESVMVGDILIAVREVRTTQIEIAIRAPKSIKITRNV